MKKFSTIINQTQTKNELKNLINWFIRNYGSIRTSKVLDQLKLIGFESSTKSGISLGISDLLVPQSKQLLFKSAESYVKKNETLKRKGKINDLFYIEKIVENWNVTNEKLKDEVIKNFRESDDINPLYIMTLSGARGNLSQVKQLVGMRGLMSDSQGEIINLPIKNNFKEGLNLTEYFISCYGARKGLVDTALKTANSGYLTRRLIYVAQNQMIKQPDCKSPYKILVLNSYTSKETYIMNKENLIGRVIARTIYEKNSRNILVSAGQDICYYLIKKILKINKIYIRSPLTCKVNTGICQLCYGWNLANGRLAELGESVGILAAQSIGEPGTQLTMRTFHTGGIFSSELSKTINSPHSGEIFFKVEKEDKRIQNKYGEKVFVNSKAKLVVITENKFNKSAFKLPKNSIIFVRPNQVVYYKQLIAEIKKKKAKNLIKTKKIKEIISPISGLTSILKKNNKKTLFTTSFNLLQYKNFYQNYKKLYEKSAKLLKPKNPRFLKKRLVENYNLNVKDIKRFYSKKKDTKKVSCSFHYIVQINISKQSEIATNKIYNEKYLKTQKKLKIGHFKPNWVNKYSVLVVQKTSSIILTRKTIANVIDSSSKLNIRNLTIKKKDILFYSYYEQFKTKDIVQGLPKIEQLLETRKTLNLEKLTENPHGKLEKFFKKFSSRYTNEQAVRICLEKIQKHLIEKIQEVYRSQGVNISNKHIEIIIRQMTCKVLVKKQGETQVLPGEIIEINKIEKLNKKLLKKAEYEPILIGISKLSLTSKSFISAASFQETAKILSKSAMEGKIDWLDGLKENVILSKLIPAGTGYYIKK